MVQGKGEGETYIHCLMWLAECGILYHKKNLKLKSSFPDFPPHLPLNFAFVGEQKFPIETKREKRGEKKKTRWKDCEGGASPPPGLS